LKDDAAARAWYEKLVSLKSNGPYSARSDVWIEYAAWAKDAIGDVATARVVLQRGSTPPNKGALAAAARRKKADAAQDAGTLRAWAVAEELVRFEGEGCNVGLPSMDTLILTVRHTLCISTARWSSRSLRSAQLRL